MPEEYYFIITPARKDEYSEVICELALYSDVLSDKKIAGYAVSELDITFAKDGENTKLISVQIRFDMNNADEGYVDLQNKLNTVYGESEYGNR